MTQPFVGQIQPFAFNFAPKGWAFCNGQLLPIQQNQALFSLLGTTFGGNGQTNFGLPDLRGRSPMSFGNAPSQTVVMGEKAGTETVVLLSNQIPQHTHQFLGSSAAANSGARDGVILATSSVSTGTAINLYGPDTTPQSLNPAELAPQGQGLPHDNMQPYLVVNWCIALQGVFPSRS